MSADTMNKSPQSEMLDTMIGAQQATTEPMTTKHRCDRCGAQALVRANLGAMELRFCGHHAKKLIPTMADKGWLFDNQSDQLLKA